MDCSDDVVHKHNGGEKAMEERQGLATKIVVLFLAIAVFLVAYEMIPRIQPTIEMDAKISPGDFKTSQQSVLELTLKNNDQANSHNMEFRFVTYNLVHIYIGASELNQVAPDSGNYSFGFILQPAEKTEQPFVVKVSRLPTGIASQEFSITVEAYADGKTVTSREVRFKAEQS